MTNTAMATQVKICGITNLEDARAACAAGAALLGFNFYRRSPRCVAPEKVREILRSLSAEEHGTATKNSDVKSVGVFVNEPSPDGVLRIAQIAGVDMVQLHGDESEEFIAAVERQMPVIRVLRVGEDFDASRFAQKYFEWLLLDSATPQYGGSGKTFKWSAAAALHAHVKNLIVAGGLNEENVAAAIKRLQPEFVDLCSGVELRPGIKDHEKIKRLIAAVAVAGGRRKAKVQSV